MLRDALLDAGRVGITRVTIRSRPALAAMLPQKKVLVLEVLRPFEELRDPEDLSIPASQKRSAEVKMAKLLIGQMSTEGWDPAQHPDRYRQALQKLLASKKAVRVALPAPEVEEGKVVDLMAALKASLEKKAGAKERSARAARRRGAA